MTNLNHFAISAGLGATLGPKVTVHHGQLASSELAATLSTLLHRRSGYINDLNPQDTMTQQYEKAVINAFKTVRDGYSSDRVLADPDLDQKFIDACGDMGLDDTPFHLNLALIGLRKHKKLKLEKSRRSSVPDQWRYAVASEIAARVMHYRYGVSVDTLLSHPTLVKEFDSLAFAITPDFTPFQYRWAALNMRKKGASIKISEEELQGLNWSDDLKFESSSRLPADKGVYKLTENGTCLFVAGSEDIHASIVSQQRIAEIDLFPPDLWTPNPQRLFWQYVKMPNATRTHRWGIVHTLVGNWKPVFNIPRGEDKDAA